MQKATPITQLNEVWTKPEITVIDIVEQTQGHQNGAGTDASFFFS